MLAESDSSGFRELERRKAVLEARLEEKNVELKKLCVAEAELTGVLPVETPLEPSGSPPKFRRRVGTMFPFTEDNFGNLKPVTLNSKGRCQISPKRARPLCQWLTGYDTLPASTSASSGAGATGSGPTAKVQQTATWSHSPTKSPSARSHPYIPKTRVKLIKKDW